MKVRQLPTQTNPSALDAHRSGFIDGPDLLSVCDARIAQFYRLWNSKLRDRLLPSRGDFDITELKPWLGWILLFDVLPDALPDGHDFKHRLVGMNFVRHLGRDLTGHRVSEVSLSASPQRALENLRGICAQRAPRYRNTLAQCVDQSKYTPPRIFVPLADDGEAVNMIMMLGTEPLDAEGKPVPALTSAVL